MKYFWSLFVKKYNANIKAEKNYQNFCPNYIPLDPNLSIECKLVSSQGIAKKF